MERVDLGSSALVSPGPSETDGRWEAALTSSSKAGYTPTDKTREYIEFEMG